ncbi:hypothetical protein [Fusobacterium ulcerans]|uniref:hypothetical protein n=1 Tax=Fusobacterium ulcerans TaxID=861 RepID=UPI0010313A37|nr:hypothetical protein [Fusobacterium ulcerans]
MFKDSSEFELSTIDYEILNFINKHGKIHKTKILKKFPEHIFSTEHRIKTLSFEPVRFVLENYEELKEKDEYHRPKIKYLETYSLTDKGLKELSNYKKISKEEKTKTFKTSFLYPAIATAITYIICNLLEKYFK